MKTTVNFMGRHEFIRMIKNQGEDIDDSFAIISISDYDTERVDVEVGVKLYTNCKNAIFLEFKDTEFEDCISNEQAKKLTDFIIEHEGKNFIVHCWAGVSRSAAVAKFIDEYYHIRSPALEFYKIYNKRVKSKLDSSCCVMSISDYYEELELNERIHNYESKYSN